jgi:D-alanine-D-alanine ligase
MVLATAWRWFSGGTSSEHGVSCLTAAGVLSALDRDRFDVVGIGITRTGRWILVDSETISRLGVTDGRLPELSENAAEAMLMRVSSGSELAVREQSVLSHLGPVDVALALLHGPFGEDGTIQGLFEMMGTRYVGAGVLASAVGMDKHYLKLVLAASGLPIGPFVAITAAEWRRDTDRVPGDDFDTALPALRQAGAGRLEPRYHQGG